MRFPTPHRGAMCACVCLLSMAAAANAATIAVPAGGDLQAALNAAQAGDVITLAPGATYTGNFVLPNKGVLNDFITIRSAADDSQLPGAGIRMTPAYASLLPKIRSSNNMSALRTAASANHYRLLLLEFPANVKGYGDIIALGAGDSTQTQLSQVPYALVLDRLYVHGDPLLGQKRGISLHSSDTTIINSHIADCKGIGQDTQAISGYNGPGNYLIENNYLEAAGENFLLGGADPTISNLVPTTITFRHNYLKKPVSWRDPIMPTPTGVAAKAVSGGSLAAGTYFYKVVARRTAGQTNKANSTASAEVSATIATGTTGSVTISWAPVANAEDYLVYGRTSGGENIYWKTTSPYYTDTGAAGTAGTAGSGTKWSVKNIFELKSAQDVFVEGNVLDGMWMADQPGYPIVFTPRNQSGTAPWSVVQRVTFQYNLVRHTAGGVNILGTDNLQPSLRANTLKIRHNVFDDMNASTWGSGSKPFQMGDGPDSVTIEHNTIITTDSTIVGLYGGTVTSPTAITNAVYANNLSLHNTYGIFGSGLSAGLASINAYMPGSIVAGNVLAGGSASKYPAGNFFPTAAAWPSLFAGYAAGDYHVTAASGLMKAGTDGDDVGANVDTVNAHTAIALSGDNTVPAGVDRIVITTTSLPNPMLGQAYAESLACSGGSAPCAWRLNAASSLPDGLTFDAAAGIVFGTPTTVETGTVAVEAYDPTWPTNSVSAALSITVDPPPFVVTMPPAPAGQVGVPYQLAPSVAGAMGSVTWSIASGALAAGVTLDPFSGSISGVPSAWGSYTALVQATDSWGVNRSDAKPVSMTIAPTAIAITTAQLPIATYATGYAAPLTASGGSGATTWSLAGGTLPAGLSLDANGVVSGSASEIGTFTVTVRVVDANWTSNVATRALTLTVNPPTFSITVPVAPAARAGQFYQLVATATGNVGTVSWSIGAGSLPPGLGLDAVSGTIAGTPTQWGTFTATIQATDSWGGRVDAKPLTIVVAPTALAITTATLPAGIYQSPYRASLATSGGTGAATFAVVSGVLPPGLSLSSAGVLSGTPSSVGNFTVGVQAVDSNWTSNTDMRTLTIAVNAPAFSASIAAASAGRVGLGYLLAGSASGNVGAVVWAVTSGTLPPGLTLDAATGVISGVPTTFGSFTANLKAYDSWDPTRAVVMPTTISVAPLPLAIATTNLAGGAVRQPYQTTLSATGGTGLTTWALTAGALPNGITLGANGALSGTPTAVGTFTFTVQASDAGWAGNTATQALSLAIGAREVVLYASDATVVAGTWSLVADATAAGGSRLFNPDKGAAKLAAPLASPANYFEITFQAEAGVAYHLWMRGKADRDYWGNDSVMVQFSGSTDASGAAKARIGTTSGFDLNLEDCSGCGLAGWGWQDNGYGVNVFGPDIYFAQSGVQTIRVQVKEDGFGIDQLVLSADKYRTAAPGPLRNDATILPR